jgi:hypothetical protein
MTQKSPPSTPRNIQLCNSGRRHYARCGSNPCLHINPAPGPATGPMVYSSPQTLPRLLFAGPLTSPGRHKGVQTCLL